MGIISKADGTLGLDIAEWCNGNTNDSDSFIPGSNPGSAAITDINQAFMSVFVFLVKSSILCYNQHAKIFFQIFVNRILPSCVILRRKGLAKLDFDKIYTDYSRLVYWAAYRVVSHRETAEDVTQTVFTKVLANKATLIKLAEPQLKSWLYRTATNLALDIVRRNKYEQPDAEPISELIADDGPSPEKLAIDRDRAERVRQAVDSLDDAYREVVMLHYFSNLTVREISECTGISEGTIKSRLVRARTLLAERLKNEVSLI